VQAAVTIEVVGPCSLALHTCKEPFACCGDVSSPCVVSVCGLSTYPLNLLARWRMLCSMQCIPRYRPMWRSAISGFGRRFYYTLMMAKGKVKDRRKYQRGWMIYQGQGKAIGSYYSYEKCLIKTRPVWSQSRKASSLLAV